MQLSPSQNLNVWCDNSQTPEQGNGTLLPTLQLSASILQSLRKGQISIVAALLYAYAEDLCPCFFLDSEDV